MDRQSPNRTDQPFCPYLGLREDPETHFRFPHELNSCYKVEPVEAITLVHQNRICLQPSHKNCPVFQVAWDGPLPDRLKHAELAEVRSPNLPLVFLVSGLVVLFILVSTWRAAPGTPLQPLAALRDGSRTSTAAPVVIAESPVPDAVPVLDPTSRPEVQFANLPAIADNAGPDSGPTPSPFFVGEPQTTTPTPMVLHAFPTPGPLPGTPFVGVQKFVIYRVLPGESLDAIARRYQTNGEILRALNPDLADGALSPGRLVVVAEGLTEIGEIPAFEVQYLTRGRSQAEIALANGISVEALRIYNALGPGRVVPAGRWLIIPKVP